MEALVRPFPKVFTLLKLQCEWSSISVAFGSGSSYTCRKDNNFADSTLEKTNVNIPSWSATHLIPLLALEETLLMKVGSSIWLTTCL